MERLLSFAKLPMKSDGEAPSEPGAATCSAESGPTMLTWVLSVVTSSRPSSTFLPRGHEGAMTRLPVDIFYICPRALFRCS